jgi:hypothetical protein
MKDEMNGPLLFDSIKSVFQVDINICHLYRLISGRGWDRTGLYFEFESIYSTVPCVHGLEAVQNLASQFMNPLCSPLAPQFNQWRNTRWKTFSS